MANFGLGLTQGFRTGLQAAEAYEQRQERERQRELQRQLAQVYSATPTGGPRAPTEAELQRAQAETQDIVEKDIKEFAKFGLTPEEADRYRAQTALMRQQDIDPSMGGGVGLVPTTTARVAAPYQLYGVDLGTKPDPQAIAAARGLEAARLMGAAGRVSDALALEQAARRSLQDMAEAPTRRELQAAQLASAKASAALSQTQLADAQRAESIRTRFDARLAEINTTDWKTPEDRANAVLDAIEKIQGPEAALRFAANLNAKQIGDIQIAAEKLDKGFEAAFKKGPDAVMQWVDDQNPNFTMARRGNTLITTYADGRESVRNFGNETEMMRFFAAQRSPSNFLTYSHQKVMEDIRRADAAQSRQMVQGTQIGLVRDEKTGKLQTVLTGLRYDTRSGTPEAFTMPLKSNVVPMSALDPAKLEARARDIVEKRTLITNPDGRPRLDENARPMLHNMQTALQMAQDEVINTYLGQSGAGAPGVPGWGERPGPTAAPDATPTPTPPPAGLTRPPAANPYVDAQGRPIRNPPPGAPSVMERTVVPAVERGVERAAQAAADVANSAPVRYLQGKIDRREPLTSAERERARRLGLLP